MRRLLLPRSRGLFRYAELWLEDDHLLYVSSSRFADKYARFRLADIQALVWTELPIFNAIRLAWLGLSVFMTVLLVVVPPGPWKWWSVPFGISLVFAITDVLRGPLCRVVLHTAVSTVTISAIPTMEAARNAIPELKRLIEGKQGHLNPDGTTVFPGPEQSERPAEHKKPSVMLQQVLFSVLLAHAILLAILSAANQMDSALSISATLLVAELVLGVMGAFRRSELGMALAAASGVTAALALVDGGFLLFTFVQSIAGYFAEVQAGNRPGAFEFANLREQTTLRAVWHAVMGLAGWVVLLLVRGRK